MGSHATVIGAVALATGLVCLLGGFFWGRLNLKMKLEDALDQARRSADAREFVLREQLSETMLELAGLRASAERPADQPQQFKSAQVQSFANGVATDEEPGNTKRGKKRPAQKQEPPPVIDSTEKTIQNYLKSIEEKLKHPEEEPEITTPVMTTFFSEKKPISEEEPLPVTQDSAPPVPPPPAVEPPPPPQIRAPQTTAAKDEWLEFAASLEALTRRAK